MNTKDNDLISKANASRMRAIETRVEELRGCRDALEGVAGALASAMHDGTIQEHHVFQILTCIGTRQTRALEELDVLTSSLSRSLGATTTSKPPPK